MKVDAGVAPVRRILIVEDNRGDVLLVEMALREAGLKFELIHLSDGQQALDYLRKTPERNARQSLDLILLDLNLPRRDGWEVLDEIRSAPREDQPPVVILSSSSAPHDIARAQQFGVLQYICKPSTLDEFLKVGRNLRQLWPPPNA